MTKHHPNQGPHDEIPDYNPPEIPGLWNDWRRFSKWAKVDGKYWAFYANTGPHAGWKIQHPLSPHWWSSPSWQRTKANETGEPVEWACRHGCPDGYCPDGSCGTLTPPSEEEIAATITALKRMLKGSTDEAGPLS